MGQYDAQTFLYFGGFGSESGKQEDSPRNYYDLYSVDIKEYTAKKLWELEYAGEPFTSSNSMLIDKDRGVFYALSYSNQKYASRIILHEYLLDKPGYRALADSIPYLFTDTKSYCDLYMNASRTSMYALVSSADRSNTQIEVYEIAYPPLPREEAEQPVEAPVARWKYVLPCILLIALLLLLYSMWKIRRKRTELLPEEDENNPIVAALPIDDAALTSLPPFSVQLLGEFKVFDDHKNNITTKLPPTTRSMFLLLLLSTLKEGCGISSVELKNHLWDDKDETSARNNRNVYIQKLRLILKDVAGMEIVKQDGYWKINYAPALYCDYTQALAYIDRLKSGGLDKPSLSGLLSVAMHGTLLPHINVEWLDEYKANYSNSLIETLTQISQKDELKSDWNLLLKIANVILLHDVTDEYAVKLKCYALQSLKRNRQALQCFRKFVDDYEKLYASKPELTFEGVTRFKM
jgi:DNA-binding SARP family transcriptional activator